MRGIGVAREIQMRALCRVSKRLLLTCPSETTSELVPRCPSVLFLISGQARPRTRARPGVAWKASDRHPHGDAHVLGPEVICTPDHSPHHSQVSSHQAMPTLPESTCAHSSTATRTRKSKRHPRCVKRETESKHVKELVERQETNERAKTRHRCTTKKRITKKKDR